MNLPPSRGGIEPDARRVRGDALADEHVTGGDVHRRLVGRERRDDARAVEMHAASTDADMLELLAVAS